MFSLGMGGGSSIPCCGGNSCSGNSWSYSSVSIHSSGTMPCTACKLPMCWVSSDTTPFNSSTSALLSALICATRISFSACSCILTNSSCLSASLSLTKPCSCSISAVIFCTNWSSCMICALACSGSICCSLPVSCGGIVDLMRSAISFALSNGEFCSKISPIKLNNCGFMLSNCIISAKFCSRCVLNDGPVSMRTS